MDQMPCRKTDIFQLGPKCILQFQFHSTFPTPSQVPLDFKLFFLNFNSVRQERKNTFFTYVDEPSAMLS